MQINKSLQLTPNFSLAEFISPNDPEGWQFDIKVLNNLYKVANRLQVIRDLLGKPMSITSGYRSPKHNANVGGEQNSYHTKGMAADFTVTGMSPVQVSQFLRNWTGGLGTYVKDRFNHIDIRQGPKGEAIKARF